ncbi:hypothetical protein QVE09_28285 [Paenibacillus sp. ClWae2A]|uniref:AbiJ-related protein n=1 Tax=Paenibacillus sp. ClWae2A TaxID=3057177 RepID=UPI0028F5E5D9|nr:hypothetical protein [Paenibacillus sp. ClWae2A]MDT9722798.1 hypothetical protein [Paenibacillus sp. ClWae2A]
MTNTITEITRRNLMDELLLMPFSIEGRTDFIVFLKRVWPLNKMSSTDSRFKDAEGDIWQHMIRNSDWEIDFLYLEYLDVLNIPDPIFVEFLEQILHPIIRADRDEQEVCLEIIDKHIARDGYKMQEVDQMSGYPVYGAVNIKNGPKGNIKNLIFSADGYKPEIVITDSLENSIEIIKNGEFCLVYDRPIPSSGLMWNDLVNWWAVREDESDLKKAERSLFLRLRKSLDSEPERLLFNVYFKQFYKEDRIFPALIPQVYLHYAPYTMKQLKGKARINRQRMDFLMLLPASIRVVLEVDGKQHYSVGEKSSPKLYSEMVSEDRKLKLKGYEVYRFGGYELSVESGEETMVEFFEQMKSSYICVPKASPGNKTISIK